MRYLRNLRKKLLAKRVGLGFMAGFFGAVPTAFGMPTQDASYVHNTDGTGIVQTGTETQITSAPAAAAGAPANNVIGWKDFSVKSGETVTFDYDPVAGFTNTNNYLNIVTQQNTSFINGMVQGGNDVYLVNPSGIVVGDSGSFNVGNLYLSTRALDLDDYLGDGSASSPLTAWDGTNYLTTRDAGSMASDVVVNTIEDGKNVKANDIYIEGNNISILNSAHVVTDAAGTLTLKTNPSSDTINGPGYIHIGHDDWTASTTSDTGAGYASLVTTNATPTYYQLIDAKEELTSSPAVSGESIQTNSHEKLAGNYMLAKDLDYGGASFIPIGDSSTNMFTGKFDGMYHTVSGLAVNNSNGAGLFGHVSGATIENVGVIDSTITSTSRATNFGAGAIVGTIGTGATTIRNVYSEGNTITDTRVSSNSGGIVGTVFNGSLELSNAYNTSNNVHGGLVGFVGSAAVDVTIENSYNTGTPHSGGNGIVGGRSSSGGSATLTANRVYNTQGGDKGIYNGTTVTSGVFTGTTPASEPTNALGDYSGWNSSKTNISNKGGIKIDDDGNVIKPAWRIYDGKTTPLLTSFMKGITTATYNYTTTYNKETDGVTYKSDTFRDNTKSNDGEDIKKFYDKGTVTLADSSGDSTVDKNDLGLLNVDAGNEVTGATATGVVGESAGSSTTSDIVYDNKITADGDNDNKAAVVSADPADAGSYLKDTSGAYKSAYTLVYSGQHGYDVAGATMDVVQRTVDISPDSISRVQEYTGSAYYDTTGSGSVSSTFYDRADGVGMLSEDKGSYTVGGTIKETFYGLASGSTAISSGGEDVAVASGDLVYSKNVGTGKYVKMEYNDLHLTDVSTGTAATDVADTNYYVKTLGTTDGSKWYTDGAITPKELALSVDDPTLLQKVYDGTTLLSKDYIARVRTSSPFGTSSTVETVKREPTSGAGAWTDTGISDSVRVDLNTSGFSTASDYGSYDTKNAGVRDLTINGLALGGGDADSDGVNDSWNYYLTYGGRTIYNASGVQSDGTMGEVISGGSVTLEDAGYITPRKINRNGFAVTLTDTSTGATSPTATKTYEGSSNSSYDMTGKTVAFVANKMTDDSDAVADTDYAWNNSGATGVINGDDIRFAASASTATDSYFIDNYSAGGQLSASAAAGNATYSGLAAAANNVVYKNILVTGEDAGNYMFADPDVTTDSAVNYQGFVPGYAADASGNANAIVGAGRIDKRTITLGDSGTTGVNKTYDMSNSALSLLTSRTVDSSSAYVKDASGTDGGIVSGDAVALAITDAKYQSMATTDSDGADVYRDSSGNPTAKNIKYTVSMSGDASGNYTLASDTVTAANAGTINPASVAISLGSVSKTYDGTTRVTTDMINNALAGSGYKVTLGDGRTYRGTLGSGVTGGAGVAVGDDRFTVTSGVTDAYYNTDASVAHNPGTPGAGNVTYTGTGFSLGGTDAGNYEVSASSSYGDGSITRRWIGDGFTVTDTGAKTKVYDNSTTYTGYSATVAPGAATATSGIVSADTINLSVTGADFIDTSGNKTVNATDSGLSSAATGIAYTANASGSTSNRYKGSTGEYTPTEAEVLNNYYYVDSTGTVRTLTSSSDFTITSLDESTPLPEELIQKRNVTVDLKSTTPTDIHKVYDGDALVKVTSTDATTADYLSFDNSAGGTGSGYVKYSGADDNKLVRDVSGLTDDGVTLNLGLSHYDDKNAGTGKTVTYVAQLAGSSDALANYQIQDADLVYASDGSHAGADVGTTRGYIDKKAITLDLVGVNKEYDTTSDITEAALRNATTRWGGTISGDDVSLDPTKFTGSYANNPDAGSTHTGSAYDAYAYVNRGGTGSTEYYGGYLDTTRRIGTLTAGSDILSGADAGNYTVSSFTATGKIEPRTVSVSVTDAGTATKVYDGTSAYSGTPPTDLRTTTTVTDASTISAANLADVNRELADVTITGVSGTRKFLNETLAETKDATRYVTSSGEYTYDPLMGTYESGAKFVSYEGISGIRTGSTVDLYNYRTADGKALNENPIPITGDGVITPLTITADFTTTYGTANKNRINKTYDGTDAVGSEYTGVGSDAMVNYTVTNSTGVTVVKPADGVDLSVSAAYKAAGDYEGKDVYYSGVSKATGTFADKLAARPSAKGVTYTATLADDRTTGTTYAGDRGDDSLNYNLVSNLVGATGTITPKKLTDITVTGIDKVYDKTATVNDWSGATATLSTVRTGDEVSFNKDAITANGTYDSANVGTGRTISGFTYDSSKLLTGKDAGNYTLWSSTLAPSTDPIDTIFTNVTGDISQRTLYVGFKDSTGSYTPTLSGIQKAYDGTTAVDTAYAPSNVLGIFADASGTAGGVLTGDTVGVDASAYAYSDANVLRDSSTGGVVADGKEIHYQGIDLTGADASNYTWSLLNKQERTAIDGTDSVDTLVAYGTIWPKTVNVSITDENIEKVYDGTSAVSSTYADAAGTSTTAPTNLTVTGGPAGLSVKTVSAEYVDRATGAATKNAGTGLGVDYTVSSDDGNYQLVAAGSAADYTTDKVTLSTDKGIITPRAVRTSDLSTADGAVKTYDGTSAVADAGRYITYDTVDPTAADHGVITGDRLDLEGTEGTYYATVTETDPDTGAETVDYVETADAADGDNVAYTDRTVKYRAMINDPNYYLADDTGAALDVLGTDASGRWDGTIERTAADVGEATGHINRAGLTATANSQTASNSDAGGLRFSGTIAGWKNGEDMSSAFSWERGTTATSSSGNKTYYPVYAWYTNSSGDRLNSGYFGNNYSLAQAGSNRTALGLYSSSESLPPIPPGLVVIPTTPPATIAPSGGGASTLPASSGLGPVSAAAAAAAAGGTPAAGAATASATAATAAPAATAASSASAAEAANAAVTAVIATRTVSSELVSDTQLTPDATIYQQASKDSDITHGETESTVGLSYQGTGVTTSTEGASAIDLESQGTTVNISDLSELSADDGVSLDSSGLIGLENQGTGVNITSEDSSSAAGGTISIETDGSAVRLTDISESSLEGSTAVETDGSAMQLAEAPGSASEGSIGLETEGLGVATSEMAGTVQENGAAVALEGTAVGSSTETAAGGSFSSGLGGTEAGYTSNSSGPEGFATTRDEDPASAEATDLFGGISINVLDEDEESTDDDDTTAAEERRRQELAAHIDLETKGAGINLGIPA